MSEFRTIRPEEISGNPFSLIGHDWMLVTAANPGEGLRGGTDYNTMTASWGGLGVLWGKPVAYVFVRPQRHTFGFIESNNLLTLSFFGAGYRDALNFCGTKSGRNCDKAAECGLTPVSESGASGRAVWFEEAKLVLVTRKLYAKPFDPAGFTGDGAEKNYPAGDFHTAYVCGIEKVLEKI